MPVKCKSTVLELAVNARYNLVNTKLPIYLIIAYNGSNNDIYVKYADSIIYDNYFLTMHNIFTILRVEYMQKVISWLG